MNDMLSTIRQNFPTLAEKALQEEIAAVGQIYEFETGDVIMDFGAYVRLVPLVIKGSIKVIREDDHTGKELFLYFLEQGDTCSMSFTCCMMHKKSDIRTIAEDDTTIIGIPIKYVDQWMMQYPSWKNFIMQSYDLRMRELIRTIDEIAFHQMDERLLHYLQQKVKVTQSTTLSATHQDIANDLNASREAVSRLLKKLEKMKKVKLGRNKIEVL